MKTSSEVAAAEALEALEALEAAVVASTSTLVKEVSKEAAANNSKSKSRKRKFLNFS